MSNQYRYVLQPYKGMNTRYHCPSCNHRDKTFALYIDTQTGNPIHSTVGRCNRESKCGYHYFPKQYFQDNGIPFDKSTLPSRPPKQPQPVSFIPVEVFKASLKGYETNHFISYLLKLFGDEVTSKLISKYFIGTSDHWPGSTVFWQIDTRGKVHTGKIMLYNPATGKRVKKPFNHITWVHKELKRPNFGLKQCLFGEHLLQKDRYKPVAIVESEKTAIIASVYLPSLIWVAVGSLSNLNAEKCKVLKGRTVILFPDLNGFDKWSNKAQKLSEQMPDSRFIVSDLLEKNAPDIDKVNGLDLADYLVKYDFQSIQPLPIIEKQEQPQFIPSPESEKGEKSEAQKTNIIFLDETLRGNIGEYWKLWPQALEDFRTNRDNMRDCFYQDFKKRYPVILAYQEFESYSLEINLVCN